MSIRCEQFIGYTVEVKNKLTHTDFDKYHDFIEKHPEYNKIKSKATALVADGMNGEYIRLIYINEHSEVPPDDDYTDITVAEGVLPTINIVRQLSLAYELFTNEELNTDDIKYRLWYHWS